MSSPFWDERYATDDYIFGTAPNAFNYPFAWRCYPQSWHRRRSVQVSDTAEKSMILHSSLIYALSQIDTFVDVSEEDLQRIYALAPKEEVRRHQQHPGVPCSPLRCCASGDSLRHLWAGFACYLLIDI